MIGTNIQNLQADNQELLTKAKKSFEEAENNSPDRKFYSHCLIKYTKLIVDAIKSNDIDLIFVLEKDAQKFDYELTKKYSVVFATLDMLENIKRIWIENQDRQFVIAKYTQLYGQQKIELPVIDYTMHRYVEFICKKITKYQGLHCTPAEKDFYTMRKKALRFIEKEHIKMINEHLGLSK